MTYDSLRLARAVPLALLGLLAGCPGSTGSARGATADSGASLEGRPNVLLITLDTTRADYLSTYGYEAGATPNLDGLAAEGIRFDMALSAAAVTPVSHASILTGSFPYRHGLRVLSAAGGFRLPTESIPLSTRFARAGYATGAVHSAFPVSSYFGFDRDFDTFDSMDGALEAHKAPSGQTTTSWSVGDLQRRSDETTDRALAFAAGTKRPFFLWIHYWDPHDPMLMPPDEFLKSVSDRDWNNAGKDQTYAVEVKYLDQEIGRLFAGLRALGVYDDTIVAVTADHGQGLEDGKLRHDWMLHRMLYQEQIHVPLILRIPGGPSGRAVPDLVRTVDIAPTLMDYGGLPADDTLDGRTLRPLIEGEGDEPRVAYADQINGYDFNASGVRRRPGADFMYCLVKGDWKLIYKPSLPDKSELYDLRADPDELENRYGDQPEIALDLLADLAQRNPWVTAPLPPDAERAGDASSILEGIGYEGGSEDSDVEWQWVCPVHREFRADRRGRHEACGAILVPAPAEGN